MRGEEKINIKLFFVQYEPYYTGATTAGAQYVFATGNSQNTTSGNANGSGTSINGNGVTSPSTGPPPLQSLPPPPTHFYASTATHHHHHPAVPAGPPASQMDHVYYSFTTGHPQPPPHAQIGLGDQQLLLYTTDPSCQPQTTENQTNQQEVMLFFIIYLFIFLFIMSFFRKNFTLFISFNFSSFFYGI